MAAQFVQSAAQAIFQSAARQGKDPGCFRQGKALIVMQMDDLAFILGQFVHRRIDPMGGFDIRRLFKRSRTARRHGFPPGVWLFIGGMALPQPIDKRAISNAVHPGADR